MSFNNKLVSFLIIAALIVWGKVIYDIAIGMGDKTNKVNTEKGFDFATLEKDFGRSKIKRDSSIRNPFESYLYAAAPVVKTVSIVKKEAPPKVVVSPPTFTLNGLLYGAKPMAILKVGAGTSIVKIGDIVQGYQIMEIKNNEVLVSKDGATFTIKR